MLEKKIYPTYFVFAALGLYLILFVLPSILGIGYSFTDWSAYSEKVNLIGLENYKLILSDKENYLSYMGNTLKFTFVTTIAKNVIGLALALLLTKKIRFVNFHRAVIFIPSVLSTLIVGMIFKSILNPKIGLLNTALGAIGINGLNWLIDKDIAFMSVMWVDIWKGSGYIMTLFIAGIMSIPATYYEAAYMDGATAWHRFSKITVPMLLPTITTATVLNIIYGLKVFDIVYALTNGGPGFATEVINTGIYKEFGMGRYAVGSTLSTVMFVIMLVIGVFLIKFMNKNEVTE